MWCTIIQSIDPNQLATTTLKNLILGVYPLLRSACGLRHGSGNRALDQHLDHIRHSVSWCSIHPHHHHGRKWLFLSSKRLPPSLHRWPSPRHHGWQWLFLPLTPPSAFGPLLVITNNNGRSCSQRASLRRWPPPRHHGQQWPFSSSTRLPSPSIHND